jgi:hypothetical protein
VPERLAAQLTGTQLPTQFLPAVRRPPQRRVRAIADKVPMASIYLLIVSVTLLQRFVVRIGEFAIFVSLPVAFLVLVALGARRHLAADVPRVALYVAALAVCLISNFVVTVRHSHNYVPSVPSLLLLCIMYVPLCFRASPAIRSQFPRALDFFQKIMIVGAIGCIIPFTLQAVGVTLPYQDDLFATYLPPEILPDKEAYNTNYPIYYGSDILKANGIFFLEPSFCSQFLALAIIIQLMLKGGRWRLALYITALVMTVSGTGIAVLAVGLLVLALRKGGKWTARTIMATFFVGLIVYFTPIGELLVDRSGESTQTDSSGNSRFVAPFENVLDAIARDQTTFVVGRGAAAVDADSEAAFFNPRGVNVNYSAIPKLIGEYGVPAMLIFVVFILTVFFRNVPSPTLGTMAVMIYFVLSGSLLQPPTVYTCWLLTGLFAAARAGEVAGHRHRLSFAPVEPIGRRPPLRPVPQPRRPGPPAPHPPNGSAPPSGSGPPKGGAPRPNGAGPPPNGGSPPQRVAPPPGGNRPQPEPNGHRKPRPSPARRLRPPSPGPAPG